MATTDQGVGGVTAAAQKAITCPRYSRAERMADALVHALGVGGALMAVPILVTLATVWHAELPAVTAAVVYGLSLIAMFCFSAAYHLVPHPTAKEILRRFDRAAIFMTIAATYTPFAVMLAGAETLRILAIIWGAALVGVALEIAAPRRFEAATLALYLAMGWAVLAIGGPILEGLTPVGFRLMVTGGVLYTVGVGFYLWDRLPYQNAIWHLLVLMASFVFYAAVLVEVRASSLIP